jgi:hypothetical protein
MYGSYIDLTSQSDEFALKKISWWQKLILWLTWVDLQPGSSFRHLLCIYKTSNCLKQEHLLFHEDLWKSQPDKLNALPTSRHIFQQYISSWKATVHFVRQVLHIYISAKHTMGPPTLARNYFFQQTQVHRTEWHIWSKPIQITCLYLKISFQK